MQVSEYDLVKKVQEHHWWWLGRAKLINTVIRRYMDLSKKLVIADVGCGFGANISMLRQYGDVTGLELNSEAIRAIELRWGNSVSAISWMSPNALSVRFNFMLLADVLEHIPDDKGAIDWIHEHLSKNGYALITVPAHKFLWTQMDEVLNHHRRYSRQGLLDIIDERFEIIYCSYYNMFLFPIKIAFVLFDRIKSKFFPLAVKRSYNDVPPALINNFFKFILKFESLFICERKLPFGVSILCLIKKK